MSEATRQTRADVDDEGVAEGKPKPGDEERGRTAESSADPEKPDPASDGESAKRPQASVANSAADNYGQLVQDAVIHGGMHFHGAAADPVLFGAETARMVREVRRVDPERVAVIRATFVASQGYSAFASEFQQCRVGVVTGRPGTGRAAAAINTLDSSGLQIREVPLEAQEREWRPDLLPVESGHAYLLDITLAADGGEVLRRRIREYARRTREQDALLIVVAESWQEDPADGYAVLAIAPPDVEEVFARHLSHFLHHSEAERWSAEPKIRTLLSGQDPAYATRLAKQIQRMNEPALGLTDFADRLEAVLGVFQNYKDSIRLWFAKHEQAHALAEERRLAYRAVPGGHAQAERREDLRPSDYLRVLMEASAVLEGCPSDAVLLQVDRLATAWKVPIPLESPISGGGVTAMLKEIGASVGSDDRIRFQEPGLGDVVLDHMWHEYPKARSSLLTWSNRAASEIPFHERSEVARRWLHLAERQHDAGPVLGLLAAWGRDNRLRSAVVPVIAQAAVHDELGPEVRAFLYKLAYGPSSGSGLDQAVAQVCGQYGVAEPRTALVRLAWLADRAAGATAKALTQALDAITSEPSCLSAALAALIEWTSDPEARRRAGFSRRYLGRLLAVTTPDEVPYLALQTDRFDGELTVVLLAEAMGAALSASKPRDSTDVLDVWLRPLTTRLSPALRSTLTEVVAHAATVHTAANIRIGDRLATWTRRHDGQHLSALADRISVLDPFLEPTGKGELR